MAIEQGLLPKVVAALGRTTLFSGMDPKLLHQVAGSCSVVSRRKNDFIVKEGESSDAFYVILSGEAKVLARHETRDEWVELTRLGVNASLGEIGLLLDAPRSATVVAAGDVHLLKVELRVFTALFEQTSGFALGVCRALANRLQDSTRQGGSYDVRKDPPKAETLALLPLEFVQRHRVLPLASDGNRLTAGFVDAPTPRALNLIQQQLPALEVRAVQISSSDFDWILRSVGGQGADVTDEPDQSVVVAEGTAAPKLNQMLKRMVAEGASDLHLSGGHKPRWRVDGHMVELQDSARLGPEEVRELVDAAMLEHHREEFEESNDTDFSYPLPGSARFRVNLFRDAGGVGAVLRVIPAKILTLEQLALPDSVRRFCDNPKGLCLVTGPTGSGKSTTLAAMIDHINKTVPGHIITMEDPIEFVHQSKSCLVNQRELGSHTTSFTRALRAALREDPDVVLVGELRDLETVSLALEIANTGHLVFGTLHTTTAIGTIERIVEMFPHDEQTLVRAVLADTLIGVVAQTLCRRKGGGRVGIYEILVGSSAVSNCIREGKGHQITSLMQTGKTQGNTLLNEELARNVREGIVEESEALSKTVDKKDLEKRLAQH
jgi:twitching motility protein PilT